MTLPPLSLAIVGSDFPNADKSNRRFELMLCKPGEPVELTPEPTNKADPHAIAVLSERGIQIGYVSAERSPRIGAIIREGREVRAVFQRPSRFGGWIRVAFDGEEPIVTPEMATVPANEARQQPQPGLDFYPDEEWPDE